jgi:hypothetical protein
MTTPNKSLRTILPFPGERHGYCDQQPEPETVRFARSNDQLVHTLERLRDSYRALLVGERIANAEEILAEVSNALMTAATAGNGETA